MKTVGPLNTLEMVEMLRLAQWAEDMTRPKPMEIKDIVEPMQVSSDTTDIHCTLTIWRERITVAFPCTHTVGQVLVDLRATMDEWECAFHVPVAIHSGFLASYLSIERKLFGAITELIKSRGRREVYVSGYSLGGAVATLFAARAAQSMEIVMVTAGSPRAGDARFRNCFEAYNKGYIRLVHGNTDAYTTVPQTELKGGRLFYHVGQEVILDGDEIAPTPRRNWLGQKWHEFSRWISAKLSNPIDLDSAKLHSIDSYIDALKRI